MDQSNTASVGNATWLTVDRLRRMAIVFALVGVSILSFDAWQHTRHGITTRAGEQLGRDFVNYWSGAHLALEGNATAVYDIPTFLKYERDHTAPNAEFKWYSYPPITLLLTLPLAVLGYIEGLVLWIFSGLAIVGAMLTRLVGKQAAVLATIATPAAFLNAWSGQNGQFTAALIGGGIMLLERRPYFAGGLFGCLSFKPHLAILIPIALAAGGHWRALAMAGTTSIGLCLASIALFGSATWVGFLHNSPFNLSILQQVHENWHRMPTVFTMARLLAAPIPVAYSMQAISSFAAALVIVRIWRSGAPAAFKGTALIIATFLATPYAWDYDTVVVIFALALYWVSADRASLSPLEKNIMFMVILMPVISLTAIKTHLQLGPIILWAALLMVARRAHAAEKGTKQATGLRKGRRR